MASTHTSTSVHAAHPAGSQLEPTVGQIDQVFGPGGGAKGSAEFAPGSFSVIGNWRGNGAVRLNFANAGIHAGSRVSASVSEYNTAWNVDRFIGNADLQVLNVAPYNGGVWLRVNVGWNSPINVCVSLFVDP